MPGDDTPPDGTAAPTRRDVLRATGGGLTGLALAPTLTDRATATETTATTDPDLKFLFTNTYLFDGVPPFKDPAPDQEARAHEFGRRIEEEDFDVAALCEVFDEEDRERILDPIDGPVRSETGPEGYWTQFESGLQTIVRNLDSNTVTAVDQHWYDAGSWSVAKGVLYLQIDVGPGQLDVYSTHTYVDIGIEDGYLSHETSYYRREQLEELVEFVEETKAEHDPDGTNPTVVCGDFNVDAATDEYDNLQWMADQLDCYDAWTHHRDGTGPTWKARDGKEYDGGDMYGICEFEAAGDHPYYCTEHDQDAGMRLDYVFVSDPDPDHDVALTVDLLRRRPWWRDLDTDPGDSATDYWQSDAHETTNYLSDHMGLEAHFTVTEN